MGYVFDFSAIWDFRDVLVKGVVMTLVLTLIGTVFGVAVGIAGAIARSSGPPWVRGIVGGYVELIRNTPFIVQLYFVFFGLPSLGVKLGEWEAAILAMVINLGAYATEIVRAGIAATPKGQWEAGASLALSRAQIFRYVVMQPALKRIWPALSSQIVIVMLGSSVCSQIAAEELTYAANFIQSRNFRAFETYFVVTALYLGLAVMIRALLKRGGDVLFARRAHG